MTLYWRDHFGRDWPVCSCLKAWLPAYEAELLRRGLIHTCIDVYQTIGNASASAGFHSKGGCVDLGQRSLEQLRVARNMGGAAWERDADPNDGQPDMRPEHTHITLKGCPHAYYLAKAQVTSCENGHNGLAGNGPDDGPRSGVKWPLRTWEQGIEWAKEQGMTYPADVIDLTNYKLTKDDGSEVKQPALAKYTDARFHVTASGDGVAFRARCGGGTTPNSTHTRCELREMTNNGLNVAAWDNHHGTHEQSAAYRVEHLPKNQPEAVAMQIHDKYDDVVMVRLVGDPAHPLAPIKVYAEWSKGKGLGSVKELLGSVHLGQKFYVRIVADSAGIRVRLQVSGSPTVTERKRATVKAGLYFKAGCYNQSDTDHDAASDYAEIVIYKNSLRTRHVA